MRHWNGPRIRPWWFCEGGEALRAACQIPRVAVGACPLPMCGFCGSRLCCVCEHNSQSLPCAAGLKGPNFTMWSWRFENMPKMSRCQPRVRNSVAPGLARGCFEALEALILSPHRSRGGDELGFPEAKGANGTVLAHTVVLTTGLGLMSGVDGAHYSLACRGLAPRALCPVPRGRDTWGFPHCLGCFCLGKDLSSIAMVSDSSTD